MLRSPRPAHRIRLGVAAALLASAALAACGSDASTRTTSPAVTTAAPTTAAATTVPATTTAAGSTPGTDAATTTAAASTTTAPTVPVVPAGVTLRIGDQLDYLKTLLSLSGQDQDFPYQVEYSAFIGGPPMLQAFQAGALDSGLIGTTPLIFAQAAGLDLTAVAAWATADRSSYSLVTAPWNTDITGWADLKGKTVAFQSGTAGEAVLLQGLDSVGLKESDITPANVSQIAVTATLEGGSADAGIQIEPLTSAYLAADPTAKSVVAATQLPDRTSVLIATKDALGDAGKTAALADYATRLVKAFAYIRDHPEALANGVYVKTYGLTPQRALELVTQNGPTSFFAIPGDLLTPQQQLADLFVAAGQVPKAVDVSGEFDPRFNDLILATQGS